MDEDQGLQGKGFPNFLRGNLHQGVIEELLWLLASKEIMSREQITVAATGAGVSLDLLEPLWRNDK